MKYYRTENSIWENPFPHKQITPELAIAQSDSIEDLCDEFVMLDQGAHIFIELTGVGTYFYKYGEEEIYSSYYPLGDEEIYGAIWTDNGLKYVAKMNDKKELELL